MKVSQQKASQRRGSFTTVYAEAKNKELDIARDRFEWEKEVAHKDDQANKKQKMEVDSTSHKEDRAADMKKALMLKLIEANKTPDEIKAYLDALL